MSRPPSSAAPPSRGEAQPTRSPAPPLEQVQRGAGAAITRTHDETIARAEAESIATRWVPAHMTARQGLVDNIAASLINARRLERDRAEGWIREAEGDGVAEDYAAFVAPAAQPVKGK